MTIQKIYGDMTNFDVSADASLALVGGDDKIYGGNNLYGDTAGFEYIGGAGSDLISIGGGSMG